MSATGIAGGDVCLYPEQSIDGCVVEEPQGLRNVSSKEGIDLD